MGSDLDTWLEQGIAAAKAGDEAAAKELLLYVLRQDERNETAWLWLASVVESEEEQRICLDNVLTIDPANQNARAWLAAMEQPAITYEPASGDHVVSLEELFAATPAEGEAILPPEEPAGCPYCGQLADADDRKCPQCGKRLIVEQPIKSATPGSIWFVSGSWVLLAAVFLAVSSITVSALLAVLGLEQDFPSASYVQEVVSTYIIDLSPRTGWLAERLAGLVQGIVFGEAILIAWFLIVALILPRRRFDAGLVASFVLVITLILVTVELACGVYTSLIKLASTLVVGSLLLRGIGEFRIETIRHELGLDRGLVTSLDYYNRGRRYREQGMLAKAILHWERAVALEPDRAVLRVPLSNALCAAGRYSEAVSHVREALRASPGDQELRQFLEHILAKVNAQ
ncbi:MAG: tetratricopeptide repeat protein [Thermoflexales bacterium]|nr:tetratricopeptide repeat protein [Thermoflexales bacterium]